MWVEPVLNWAWFAVPDVGEIIEIEVQTGAPEDETRGQMSLDSLSPRWKGGRHYNEDEDAPTPVHPDLTERHYGKRRGINTPLGHTLVFDDTENAAEVALTWSMEKDAAPEKRTQLLIDKDGHATLSVLGKHTIVLQPNRITVQLDEGAAMDIQGKDGDATTVLGDGAVEVAIAPHLRALYNSLKDYIEGASVQTGMGPSSTILVANGPAPSWDAAIESSKLTIPDG